MERKTHLIDAKNKVLGRLASQIAILLQGKGKSNFKPYKNQGDFIIVKNVGQMKITGKKLAKKKYYYHSGYPGGLKEISLGKILKERPAFLLKKAVLGMLPKNRLRKKLIKRLKIENG